MNQERRLSLVIGSLFLTTVLAGMWVSYGATPLLSASFDVIRSNRGVILAGAFLTLAMSIGVVGIALGFFPVIRRFNWGVAATYVSLRIVECVLLLVGTLVPLFVLGLSQQDLSQAAPELSSLAALAVRLSFDSFQVAMTILGFNSVALFVVIYRQRLLPRWLSALAVVGYVLLGTSGILALCGLIDTRGVGGLLYVPGGLVELVLLPFWLLTRGFLPKSEEILASTRH